MTESEAIKELKEDIALYDNEITRLDASIGTPDRNLIDALDMAIQALEKQIPKKPIKSENQVVRYVNTYYCPICNLGIAGTNIAKWCYHCGQKLDWSDEE